MRVAMIVAVPMTVAVPMAMTVALAGHGFLRMRMHVSHCIAVYCTNALPGTPADDGWIWQLVIGKYDTNGK